MALLAQITAAQAVQLANRPLKSDSLFNPFQIGEEWYISAEEVRDCVTVDWVKDLEVVEVELPDPEPLD
jgi:hypothetical protein